MPEAGLFAGTVTESAPSNGAVTTKQNGYHWMQWADVLPTSGEYDTNKGYAGTQDQWFTGVDYPHPLDDETWNEITASTVFRANRALTSSYVYTPYSLIYGLSFGIGILGGQSRLDCDLNTSLAVNFGGRDLNLNSAPAGTTGWLASHWYCLTASYSLGLDVGSISWVNMSLGLEVLTSISHSSPAKAIHWDSGPGGGTSRMGWGCAGVVDAPIRPQGQFHGAVANTFVHNTFIDLTVEGNRRLFSGIDGIVNLGMNGQIPFGEIPKVYMPSGGPWDNRGTINVGNYPSDFVLAEPLELDTSLPPIAS